MKKVLSIFLAGAILSTATSCLGKFNLTKGLLNFNNNLTNSRFVNNLVFYAFLIVPVYEVALFIDVAILNLIEFWTGTNPVSMNDGDFERQTIPFKGKDYIVEATKNQFKIYEEGQEPTYLRFDPADQSWTAVKGEQSQKLTAYHQTEDGGYYQIFKDDRVISLKAGETYSQSFLQSILNREGEITASR